MNAPSSNGSLYFTDISLTATYAAGNKGKKRVNYQKLHEFMAAFHFLTNFWDPQTHPNASVVVVSANLNEEMVKLLEKMFSSLQFTRYSTDREGKKFSKTESRKWTEKSHPEGVLFICSLPTPSYFDLREQQLTERQARDELDRQNRAMMELQSEYLHSINPTSALLTIQFPYGNEKFTYFDGFLFKPIWGGLSSTQTHLVPVEDINGRWIVRDWDLEKHQDKMFFYNSYERENMVYENLWSADSTPYNEELGNGHDDTMTMVIIKMYLEKYMQESTLTQALAVFKIIMMKLNEGQKKIISLSELRNTFHRNADIYEKEDAGSAEEKVTARPIRMGRRIRK